MIAPVRNTYAQRVAGSRVVAGARNVAQVAESPTIQTAAESKRTGAQEESLIDEGAERMANPSMPSDLPPESDALNATRKSFRESVDDSLAWNQRVREATEAYRNTIENLDNSHPKLKPGDVYDVPF